jgi:hypothetical protein
MNCIDAMEGSFISLIQHLHQAHVEEVRDDTAYIRNIRAIMEAVDAFLGNHPELSLNDPRILKSVLYDTARSIWMESALDGRGSDDSKSTGSEAEEYLRYYYDYIYHNGAYPP